MIKQLKKWILCEKIVDEIFKSCRAYDFTDGKARFWVDEDLLKILFGERYTESKAKAEKEYAEGVKNV